MKSGVRTVWLPRLGIGVAVALLIPAILAAAGRPEKPKADPSQAADAVEMFSAIEQGQIGVKLIPKDSTQCRVLIENKTKKPLNVKLPDAFAAVPVLAQIGGAGVGGAGRRGGAGGGMGGNQGMGGGMGGMGGGGMGGMGMGGMGGGMGMMCVPPEKVGQLKVTTVCLDHGKTEPRPNMQYEIRPIDQYTDRPAVHELVRLLGEGRINQRAAQAAAWHLNNDMSWEQLAAKQLRFANGTSRPYFAPEEIAAAMQVSAASVGLAEKHRNTQKSGSLSHSSSN